MVRSLLFSFLIFLIPTSATTAQNGPAIAITKCYAIEVVDSPDSEFYESSNKKETWCYYRDPYQNHLFIFNGDTKIVRPELSLLVDENGILTHGSLLAGHVSYHRTLSKDYNPLPIPLSEPINSDLVENFAFDPISAAQVYESFLKTRTPIKKISLRAAQSTHLSARALDLPWRGFWWAYKNQHLSKTENSPLGKLDRFLKARAIPAGSRAWEDAHHVYKGISWEGHCNGWAASSILRSEPKNKKFDSISGVIFSIDDQKGLLSEMDYCALTSFYGSRYRGRVTDNQQDIVPSEFHKTVTYYIGELQKPVIMDYMSGVAVDNHPVSGYDMEILRKNENTLEVTAKMIFHKYDKKTGFKPGPAPIYIRTYKYTLTEDAEGQIIGGTWLSDNPDFIWVPLSPKDCDRNNPFLSLELMDEILNLPSK